MSTTKTSPENTHLLLGFVDKPLEAGIVQLPHLEATAFHAWLRTLRGKWRDQGRPTRLVLIADNHLQAQARALDIIHKAARMTGFDLVGLIGPAAENWARMIDVPVISQKPEMTPIANAIRQRNQIMARLLGNEQAIEELALQLEGANVPQTQAGEIALAVLENKSSGDDLFSWVGILSEHYAPIEIDSVLGDETPSRHEVEVQDNSGQGLEKDEDDQEQEQIDSEQYREEETVQQAQETSQDQQEHGHGQLQESVAIPTAQAVEDSPGLDNIVPNSHETATSDTVDVITSDVAEESAQETGRRTGGTLSPEYEDNGSPQTGSEDNHQSQEEGCQGEERGGVDRHGGQEGPEEGQDPEGEMPEAVDFDPIVAQEVIASLRQSQFVPSWHKVEQEKPVAQEKAQKHESAEIEIISTPAQASRHLSVAPKRISGIVRTGTVIEHDGDIIIEGAVHDGAEIRAGGDIHIYGLAGGRLFAGCNGNPAACLYINRFDAEIVSIDGRGRVFEEIPQNWRRASMKISLDPKSRVLRFSGLAKQKNNLPKPSLEG